jgi:hypothetical protein
MSFATQPGETRIQRRAGALMLHEVDKQQSCSNLYAAKMLFVLEAWSVRRPALTLTLGPKSLHYS